MAKSDPQHYRFAQTFTIISFIIFAFTPMYFIPKEQGHIPSFIDFVIFAWPVVLGVLFIFVRDICGSEKMPYGRGLVFVPWALRSQGWIEVIFLGFPSLLIVFLASVAITAFCRLFNQKEKGPIYFMRLISWFNPKRKPS